MVRNHAFTDAICYCKLQRCFLPVGMIKTSIAELFYRASYLCKAATKSYGNGCHGFGTSRT